MTRPHWRLKSIGAWEKTQAYLLCELLSGGVLWSEDGEKGFHREKETEEVTVATITKSRLNRSELSSPLFLLHLANNKVIALWSFIENYSDVLHLYNIPQTNSKQNTKLLLLWILVEWCLEMQYVSQKFLVGKCKMSREGGRGGHWT